MKKFLTILSVSILTCGASSYAMASDQEKRVEHYEVHIETTEMAFKALSDNVANIAVILETKEALAPTAMEDIHKISYTLEAAVDKLRDEKAAFTDNIDALDETVQAIHYASENKKEAKARDWFERLSIAANNINNQSGSDVAKKKEFYEIIIKDHKFFPETLIVPAGKKIKLIIHNQDPTPEEFESHDLNREKIISGNRKAKIFIGPLKPGKYHYFGEFNMDSANGYIIAK